MRNNLTPIEREGRRVLTTAQLAEAYGTDTKHINDNFANNKDRYKLCKHYFVLEGKELKQFKKAYPIFSGNLKYAPVVYLWTEKGALHHAKSLNTDKAWEVYESLVDDYFNLRNWSLHRELTKAKRQTLTDAIRDFIEESPNKHWRYKHFTDLVYKTVFGKSAKELKLERGIRESDALRDSFTAPELAMIEKAEILIAGLIMAGETYEVIKVKVKAINLIGLNETAKLTTGTEGGR